MHFVLVLVAIMPEVMKRGNNSVESKGRDFPNDTERNRCSLV